MIPPLGPSWANFRSENSFMATSTSGCEIRGDPIRSFDKQTWQCALPERLWPIRRQPAYFQFFAHAHFDEELPQQQHALSSEAGDLDLDILEMVGVVRVGSIGRSLFRGGPQRLNS